MNVRVAAYLGTILLLAGCVGGESTTDATPASSATPAPEPMVDAETGSIIGTVVDEEKAPIEGASVTVTDSGETKTDAAGSFTFNGILPGEHTLMAVKLGYEQVGRKVVVEAGQVAELDLVLTAIQIADVYHETFQKTGVVTGQWTVNYVQNFVNNSVVDSILCGPCTWLVLFPTNIKDAVTDVLFKPSVTGPGLNEIIIWTYNKSLNAGETYSGIASHEMEPRSTYHWSEGQVKGLKGVPKARLQLSGPDPDNPGIAFQQRVDLWQTWGFGDLLADEFSMLPPP